MNLKTVFARTTEQADTSETDQQSVRRCECGKHPEETVVAGVRHIDDEPQLYCANCL